MKRSIVTVITAVLLCSSLFASTANANGGKKEKEATPESIAKLKKQLSEIGVGAESNVKLKLTDGTKITGHLSEINSEDFVVVSKGDVQNRVPYKRVHSAHGNHGDRYFKYAMLSFGLSLLTGFLYLVSR